MGAISASLSEFWLIGASLFFYGWSEPKYVLLLVCSVLLNFSVGAVLNATRLRQAIRRKIILILGIAADIALLGYYKYADFAITNLNYVFHAQFALRSLVVPVGLSFFTFIQISYLVDSYRNPTKGYDLLTYGLFATYFPYILSGPIVHHSEIIPQLRRRQNRRPTTAIFLSACTSSRSAFLKRWWWPIGWASGPVRDSPPARRLNFLYAWVSSLCYTFQIYFDFSGYTDMALGAALMFNIRLPINFNSPYKALDIQDFWRRWHITLGRFLREYIYIPLGGSRVEEGRVYFNLMVTFIICGIWHGAGWTFVFWGFLHGAALVVHRRWKKMGGKMPAVRCMASDLYFCQCGMGILSCPFVG